MNIVKQVKRLQERIIYLEAALNGSESQTREATVNLLGLVLSLMVKQNIIEHVDILSLLAEAAGADYGAEDHNGRLIHDLRRIIEYYHDLAEGTVKQHIPLEVLLSAEERALLLRRARLELAFEATNPDYTDNRDCFGAKAISL